MPIRKRPSAKKRTAKQRQNLTEQLDDLAILLAAYRSRLNDALNLLEGVDCFRNVHSQIGEILACLDESAVCFSEYLEELIDQDELLMYLQFYGPGILLRQLNYLGTPDPDDDADNLVEPLSALDDNPVVSSPQRHTIYPPGMAASILDQEPDEEEETDRFGCTVRLLGLKQDVALIFEHLIDQIRAAGFRLHDDISRLDH